MKTFEDFSLTIEEKLKEARAVVATLSDHTSDALSIVIDYAEMLHGQETSRIARMREIGAKGGRAKTERKSASSRQSLAVARQTRHKKDETV